MKKNSPASSHITGLSSSLEPITWTNYQLFHPEVCKSIDCMAHFSINNTSRLFIIFIYNTLGCNL